MHVCAPNEIPSSKITGADDVLDVDLTDSHSCDLCDLHMGWECPRCGLSFDLFRDPSAERYVRCHCGVVHRITATEVDRWERDGYGGPR